MVQLSHILMETCVVGTHWKRLNETLPMSTFTNDYIEK